MEKEKLKKILDALDGISHQEFKKLSEYISYKTEAVGKFKNDELAYETVKTFFMEIQDQFVVGIQPLISFRNL